MEELVSKEDFRIGDYVSLSKEGKKTNATRIENLKKMGSGTLIKLDISEVVCYIKLGEREVSFYNRELCYNDTPLEISIMRIKKELNKLEQLIKIKSEK